jgi:hypothetical protein
VTSSARTVTGRRGSYLVKAGPIDVPAGNARLFEIEDGSGLLYKEFKKPARGGAEVERIDTLVDIGTSISGNPSSPPAARRIAWPRDLVVKGKSVVGVVVPHVGDRFYRPEIEGIVMPRDLSYLRRDEEADDMVRLRLMRQLAGMLGVLEHAELVHGDIAQSNLIWSPAPEESIVLVDCDGIHRASVAGSEAATPDWTDPRKKEGRIRAHDMQSDWFALALAIWRVLGRTREVLPPSDNGRPELSSGIPAPVRKLLERAFGDLLDPDARPAPREWAAALDSVLGVPRTAGAAHPGNPQTIDPAAIYEHAKKLRRRRKAGEKGRRRRWVSVPRVLFLTPLLAVALVLASGLLDPGPPPRAQAQAAVADWARSRLETQGIAASCPRDSSLDPGAHYRCHVETAGGAVARVVVKVGEEGNVRRRIHVIAYRRRAFLTDIRNHYRHLRKSGDYGLTLISCPQTFDAEPGLLVTCPAEFTDGVVNGITIRLKTRRGRYTWHEEDTSVGGQASAMR